MDSHLTIIDLKPEFIIRDELLCLEVASWLLSHVGWGSRMPGNAAFESWCWYWKLNPEAEKFVGVKKWVAKIAFRDRSAALLFKLTWGGS